jgi:hypothetical protein
MKFAYADPPYFMQGKRLYAPFHDEAHHWDSQEKHQELIEKLENNYPDGWALSCNPADLSWMLPLISSKVRVCAWTKSFHQIRPKVNVQYSWEPVILSEGRIIRGRKPMVRDHLVCPIAMKKGLPGAKPDRFCDWILDLLGYDEIEDQIDDLFPGTYGIDAAIKRRFDRPLTLPGIIDGACS